MQRITQKDLENLCDRINAAADTPATYGIQTGERRVAAIGNYHLDYAYGGVRLVQTMNEGGGIRVISTGGFGTKRALYHELQAYLSGLSSHKPRWRVVRAGTVIMSADSKEEANNLCERHGGEVRAPLEY